MKYHENTSVLILYLSPPLHQTQENTARALRGEEPLPDEDLTKMFKMPTMPARLDSLLMAGQMKYYCTEINRFAAQSFGKLFMSDALKVKPDES